MKSTRSKRSEVCNSWIQSTISAEARNRTGIARERFVEDSLFWWLWSFRITWKAKEHFENLIPIETMPVWAERERDKRKCRTRDSEGRARCPEAGRATAITIGQRAQPLGKGRALTQFSCLELVVQGCPSGPKWQNTKPQKIILRLWNLVKLFYWILDLFWTCDFFILPNFFHLKCGHLSYAFPPLYFSN